MDCVDSRLSHVPRLIGFLTERVTLDQLSTFTSVYMALNGLSVIYMRRTTSFWSWNNSLNNYLYHTAPVGLSGKVLALAVVAYQIDTW